MYVRLEDSSMVKCYRLDEVAIIETGEIVPKKKYFSKRGYPFISAKYLKQLILDGKMDEIPKINCTYEKYFKCTTVPAKTIILTKANLNASNKHVYQCEDEVWIAHDLVAIIPDERIILSDYLYHFLNWYQANKEWYHLYQISLNVPIIEVQYGMVQILNTVQHIIKNKEFLLTKIDGLPQYFHHLTSPIEGHVKNVYHGFNQGQHLYNLLLYRIFKGELIKDIQGTDFFKTLSIQ
ncbi:hypothetical protein C3943_23490 [Lysinibacillus sp. B2A1]|nr:hypothetical protein C3943_23490 [Lysinibacillus sp. B2A1]